MGSAQSKQESSPDAREPPLKRDRLHRLRKSLRSHSHRRNLNEQNNEQTQPSDNINRPENDNNAVREMPPVRRSQGNVDPELSTEACMEAALNFFPDICPDYLRKTVESQKWTAQGIVSHILDQQESGKKYPKRVKSLKRKWEDTGEDGEEVLSKKMEAEPRFQGKTTEYMKKYKGAG